MSYCRQEGKDRIIFATKEDHETPSSAELVADDPDDPYEEQGRLFRWLRPNTQTAYWVETIYALGFVTIFTMGMVLQLLKISNRDPYRQ